MPTFTSSFTRTPSRLNASPLATGDTSSCPSSLIETALTLRLLFHLPLRQTEGFLRSIFGMLGLDLSAPDHTTLSRRAQRLTLTLRRVPTDNGIHLIVDSTGLSLVGDGEWAAVKHGSRRTRGWKKLHLGVDGSGVVVAHALTGGHVDDATTALDLINTVEGNVSCFTKEMKPLSKRRSAFGDSIRPFSPSSRSSLDDERQGLM